MTDVSIQVISHVKGKLDWIVKGITGIDNLGVSIQVISHVKGKAQVRN
jgi:hypothetical protein